MKYVALDVQMGTGRSSIKRRIVVAFPNDLCHDHMAEGLRVAAKLEWPSALMEVSSAGFIDARGTATTGESETLDMGSDPEAIRAFNGSDYSFHIID